MGQPAFIVLNGFSSDDTLSDRVYEAEQVADKHKLPAQFEFSGRTYTIGPKQ